MMKGLFTANFQSIPSVKHSRDLKMVQRQFELGHGKARVLINGKRSPIVDRQGGLSDDRR